MEEKNKETNLKVKLAAGENKRPEAISRDEQIAKLTEINNQQSQQIEMFKLRYQELQNNYIQVSNEAFYKRLEFDFKVIENSSMFSPSFVEEIINEIQETLKVPESKEEDKKE